ncbi:hypothetical protein HY969_04385 [Candidatus Kaiserbacteria bacterium]|nr:hypothetical protein [Candidatus Kaiserbacteria bacterium]
MKNLIAGVILLVIIVGGGYWYIQNQTAPADTNMQADESAMQQDTDSYPYTCDNGSEFTMAPSDNLSTIQISAGSQGAFTGTATLASVASNAGARFEGSHMGQNITFVGAGEEVQLTVGNALMICNPKPSQDMAPWNWGDAGEGGGVKQDVTVIVGESIVGKWQSVDDASFVREFKTGGKVSDWSNGKVVSTGTYTVFSSEKPVTVSFPIQANAAYLQLTMQGTQADKLNFKVNKLTPEELELTYMDRGGVLRFKAAQ